MKRLAGCEMLLTGTAATGSSKRIMKIASSGRALRSIVPPKTRLKTKHIEKPEPRHIPRSEKRIFIAAAD